MRIFVLGVGAAGSYLIKLLTRQGHHVTCGDRDPERARRFVGTAVPVSSSGERAQSVEHHQGLTGSPVDRQHVAVCL